MKKFQIKTNPDEKKEKSIVNVIDKMEKYSEIYKKRGLAKARVAWSLGITAFLTLIATTFGVNIATLGTSIFMGAVFSVPVGLFCALIFSDNEIKSLTSIDTIVGNILSKKNYNISYVCSNRKRKKIDKLLRDIIGNILNSVNLNRGFPSTNCLDLFFDECQETTSFLQDKGEIINHFSGKKFDIPIVSNGISDATKYLIVVDDQPITMEKKEELHQLLDNIEKGELMTQEEFVGSADNKIDSAEQVIEDNNKLPAMKKYWKGNLLQILKYRKDQLESAQLDELAVEEIEKLDAEKKEVGDGFQYTLYMK